MEALQAVEGLYPSANPGPECPECDCTSWLTRIDRDNERFLHTCEDCGYTWPMEATLYEV